MCPGVLPARFLEGRVAVVTGAGRGIGRATARALADAGARVVLAARTIHELEEAAQEIEQSGEECLAIPTDVTDEQSCEALIRQTVDAYGTLDILVNNAGGAVFKPMWELTTEDFNLSVDVNLRGTFFCSRAAVRVMLPHGQGTIINISSSSGKKPYPGQAAYCAAKAGVILLSKVMAMELRPYGIRVHVICPGGVDTRLAAQIHPTRSKEGWIQPRDIAQAVLYLISLPSNVSVDELVIRRFEAEPM